jgi:hypothetical protein
VEGLLRADAAYDRGPVRSEPDLADVLGIVEEVVQAVEPEVSVGNAVANHVPVFTCKMTKVLKTLVLD